MMIYKFLMYINSTDVGSTYYNVAHYIANNFAKVVDMNLEELADACYVSQATISRFCRTVGYENFSHFKLESKMALDDGMRRIRDVTDVVENQDDVGFKDKFIDYNQSVSDSMMAAANNLNMKDVDRLLDKIIQTKDVAMFGIHRCSNVIQELQFSFSLKNKFVKAFLGTPHQLEYAQNLKKDSLAIIFDADDYFLRREKEVIQVLKKNPCKKIFLTTTPYDNSDHFFEEVFLIGSGVEGVGKYVMMNFSEILIGRFFTKY